MTTNETAFSQAKAVIPGGVDSPVRAFGGVGFTVERTEDFPAALCDALAARRPAIIHVKMSVDAIAPSMSLTAIRERALAGT